MIAVGVVVICAAVEEGDDRVLTFDSKKFFFFHISVHVNVYCVSVQQRYDQNVFTINIENICVYENSEHE